MKINSQSVPKLGIICKYMLYASDTGNESHAVFWFFQSLMAAQLDRRCAGSVCIFLYVCGFYHCLYFPKFLSSMCFS